MTDAGGPEGPRIRPDVKPKSITDPQPLTREQRVSKVRGHTPVTTRDWPGIPFILGYGKVEENFWNGKRILDVGTGHKDHDVRMAFPGATVCVIDPEIDGGEVIIPKWAAHEARAGIAQDIPYGDNEFDMVWSTHAVTQHILPFAQEEALAEMIRVMRPDGEIRMTPPFLFSKGRRETLAEMGFTIEEIPSVSLPVTRFSLSREKQGEKNAIYQKLKAEVEEHKKD